MQAPPAPYARPSGPMLKLVVWNMSWLNDLFGSNEGPVAFRNDAFNTYHGDGTVRQRRDDLAGVLHELDPDLVVVTEGPNRPDELQLLFDTDIAGTWATHLQRTKGSSQCIGVALRTDRGHFADTPLTAFDTAELQVFDPFPVDIDNDDIEEQYHFERRPLYVEVHLTGGPAFRILGLHLKSKGIFKAYEWSRWWQMADANRRKLLAQASHLRLNLLDPYLDDPATRDIPLIVCGDINDGPGHDASEKRLLGSTVERLMGSVWHADACLGNALFDSLSARDRRNLKFSRIHTASFRDPIFNNTWHRVWIDHILYTKNTPAPWVTDGQVHIDMAGGERIWRKYPHASDHYPISAQIAL